MNDKISIFHKVILWITLLTSLIFGLGYYLIPATFSSVMKVNAPDLISLSTVGGFLIAAFAGAAFSLKSGLWSEVRIATYYLMTWGLLNGIRMALFTITKNDISLLPNTINCFVIGIGLAIVVCKRNCLSKK